MNASLTLPAARAENKREEEGALVSSECKPVHGGKGRRRGKLQDLQTASQLLPTLHQNQPSRTGATLKIAEQSGRRKAVHCQERRENKLRLPSLQRPAREGEAGREGGRQGGCPPRGGCIPLPSPPTCLPIHSLAAGQLHKEGATPPGTAEMVVPRV